MPYKQECLTQDCPQTPACERIPGMAHGVNCPCNEGTTLPDGRTEVSFLQIMHSIQLTGLDPFKYYQFQKHGDVIAYSLFDMNDMTLGQGVDAEKIKNKLMLKSIAKGIRHEKDGVAFSTMKKQYFHAEVQTAVTAGRDIVVDDVSRFAPGYELIINVPAVAGQPVTTTTGETFEYADGSPYNFTNDCCLMTDTVLITAVNTTTNTITVDADVTLAVGARVLLGRPNVDVTSFECGTKPVFPSNYYEETAIIEKSLWEYTAGEFKVGEEELREICDTSVALQRFLDRSRPMYETIYRGINLSKYLSRNKPAANGRGSTTMGLDAMIALGRLEYGLTNSVLITGGTSSVKALKFERYFDIATEEIYMTKDGSTPIMLALCTKAMFDEITTRILPALNAIRKSVHGCISTHSCTMTNVVAKRSRIYKMETSAGVEVHFMWDPILDEIKGKGSKHLYHIPKHQRAIEFKQKLTYGQGENWRNRKLEVPSFKLVDNLNEERRRKTENVDNCEVTYSLIFGFAILVIGWDLHGVGTMMIV